MVEIEKASKPPKKSSVRWFLGFCIASTFSLVYFVVPMYMLTALVALVLNTKFCLYYAAPLIISGILPPMASRSVQRLLSPMLDYFEYEEIIEKSPVDVVQKLKDGTNYILVCQPHGSLSFVGIASAIAGTEPAIQGRIYTAVADALLLTPILKHVMGIFGLISASKQSMQRYLKRKGVDGTIVLYVGGMAELFLSSEAEEILYLKKRKGFIKLAMQEGVDVVPVYLFGNTSVLTVWKNKVLASLSRRFQVSLTYMWGKFYLPIPRDCKLLYVSGQPLQLPYIKNPTPKDLDFWHDAYCAEVKRLFETYKERVPQYKHKTLKIV